jgi:hypothetical protein
MLKYLLLGVSAAIIAAPAGAEVVEFSCRMGTQAQRDMIALGYPENIQQVMHVSADKDALKVTVWETSPKFPDVDKSTYEAKLTGDTATWTVGDGTYGPPAHASVNFSTNVLTTIDPTDAATQWDCVR